MEKAIEAVSKNEMGWQRASKIFGVPQATLRRHALKQNKILEPKAKAWVDTRQLLLPKWRDNWLST